jgi:hypothetical protein
VFCDDAAYNKTGHGCYSIFSLRSNLISSISTTSRGRSLTLSSFLASGVAPPPCTPATPPPAPPHQHEGAAASPCYSPLSRGRCSSLLLFSSARTQLRPCFSPTEASPDALLTMQVDRPPAHPSCPLHPPTLIVQLAASVSANLPGRCFRWTAARSYRLYLLQAKQCAATFPVNIRQH